MICINSKVVQYYYIMVRYVVVTLKCQGNIFKELLALLIMTKKIECLNCFDLDIYNKLKKERADLENELKTLSINVLRFNMLNSRLDYVENYLKDYDNFINETIKLCEDTNKDK